MSKIDYILLANALNDSMPALSELDMHAQWALDCDVLAKAFKQQNPSFDAAKFRAACEKGAN